MLGSLSVDTAYYQLIILKPIKLQKVIKGYQERAINGCGRAECQTVNKVKTEISPK